MKTTLAAQHMNAPLQGRQANTLSHAPKTKKVRDIAPQHAQTASNDWNANQAKSTSTP